MTAASDRLSGWWAAAIGLIARAGDFITRLAEKFRYNRSPSLLTPLPLWMPPG